MPDLVVNFDPSPSRVTVTPAAGLSSSVTVPRTSPLTAARAGAAYKEREERGDERRSDTMHKSSGERKSALFGARDYARINAKTGGGRANRRRANGARRGTRCVRGRRLQGVARGANGARRTAMAAPATIATIAFARRKTSHAIAGEREERGDRRGGRVVRLERLGRSVPEQALPRRARPRREGGRAGARRRRCRRRCRPIRSRRARQKRPAGRALRREPPGPARRGTRRPSRVPGRRGPYAPPGRQASQGSSVAGTFRRVTGVFF